MTTPTTYKGRYADTDKAFDKFHSDKGILEAKIDLDKDKAYVISLGNNNKIVDLTPFLQEALEKKYKRKVEQINVLPYRYGDSNYVVNNGVLKDMIIQGKADFDSKVYIPVDRMNQEASESQYMMDLIDRVKSIQGDVIINVYKNSPELTIADKIEGVSILAPDAYLVDRYDDKTIQREEVACKLGLPIPRYFNAESVDELVNVYNQNFTGKAFVMLKNSSCGEGAEVVYSEADIRESKILKDPMKCSVMDFIDVELSPATLGVIGGDGVYIAGFADQLLDGPKFLGSISPSIAGERQQQDIFEITTEIGLYLQGKGYRGPFGIDFMIDTAGKVYFAEINPRVIGSTPEFSKAHSIVNPDLPSIPEIIYNSVMLDKLGFDVGRAELPQVPWARRLLSAEKGHVVRPLGRSPDPNIQVKEYPYEGTKFLSKSTIARIVYSGNPEASRHDILNAIFSEERRIKDL